MGGGGVAAVGPSGGSTVECNTGDGVPMGGMGYGVVKGADGCAPVSARRTSRSLVLLVCGAARASRRAVPAMAHRTCAFDCGSSWQWHARYRKPRLDPGRTIRSKVC